MSWPVSKLEDLCHFIKNGKSIQQSKEINGLPITRIETIANQSIDTSRVGYAGVSVESAGDFLLEVGDILFSHINSLEHLGKAAIYKGYPEKLVHGMNLLNLRPDKSKVDCDYLLRALRAPVTKGKLLRIANKSVNQASIAAGNLKKIEIPLPPLSEQRRIAAILDKVDALRAKRREAVAKLDQLLQSVFLEMFGDPVTNPKGWPVLSIQEACESIVDCVNRTAPTVDYVTDYKMIRTTNVRNFKVSLDSVRYVEKVIFDDWNRRLLPQKGDVILTREAPAGEAGVLDSDDQVFLGQRLMLYRVNQQRATPEYLLYSFMGEGMQQQFKKQSSGSTVKHLSVPDCRSWDLMLPPVELQKKFTGIVAMNWSLRQQALAHSNRLKDLFFSVQKSAFSAGP
ncbi:restriction endonuclease subunit S [Pseudomonas thivervalensis]|uniref:restriction endonuclease subunit S n=1 Tax=Pseudomonas TaxID=286 RepID=UPI003D998592